MSKKPSNKKRANHAVNQMYTQICTYLKTTLRYARDQGISKAQLLLDIKTAQREGILPSIDVYNMKVQYLLFLMLTEPQGLYQVPYLYIGTGVLDLLDVPPEEVIYFYDESYMQSYVKMQKSHKSEIQREVNTMSDKADTSEFTIDQGIELIETYLLRRGNEGEPFIRASELKDMLVQVGWGQPKDTRFGKLFQKITFNKRLPGYKVDFRDPPNLTEKHARTLRFYFHVNFTPNFDLFGRGEPQTESMDKNKSRSHQEDPVHALETSKKQLPALSVERPASPDVHIEGSDLSVGFAKGKNTSNMSFEGSNSVSVYEGSNEPHGDTSDADLSVRGVDGVTVETQDLKITLGNANRLIVKPKE